MKVLMVDAQHRRLGEPSVSTENGIDTDGLLVTKAKSDDTLHYPPLGLMKLSRFHKTRGDEVTFACGIDKTIGSTPDLFNPNNCLERVYISTLFTFNWRRVVEIVKYYKELVGGTSSRIFVGGIMSSLMAEDLFKETGIYPVTGLLNHPSKIGLDGEEDIDSLSPDYDLLDKTVYALNDTYYAYTTRGCVNRCSWCAVPCIENEYVPYIDIKPMIKELRVRYGDKSVLKLMDNNVLSSKRLPQIVDDLLQLGFGRGALTDTGHPKQRVVDFNQGLDASFLNDNNMKLLSKLCIRPMRVAFDRLAEKNIYVHALALAKKHGFTAFSNYMLYNYRDSPKDLHDRLMVNIGLNESWAKAAKIYSYPMRFAPIKNSGSNENRERDLFNEDTLKERNWLKDAIWTKRFARNIEIMKGAAHGAISPTPSLALRTIGKTYEEFLCNLYMPEELLRNRNKHEKAVHIEEPKRRAGTGKIEEFKSFMTKLLGENDERFKQFHAAVSPNTFDAVRLALKDCPDRELRKWLLIYLRRKG
jgi:hypothetical protein